MFNDKNCQTERNINMWPKKSKKDMWSNRPVILIQHNMLKKQEILTRRPVKSKVCSDKKCQTTKYYKEIDKNCQTSVMQPVKPQMDVWLKKPEKKSIGLAKGKNCQATICKNTDPKSHMSRNSDKNCQENENNVMWSVTKKTDVWLPKPVRLCSDKNFQSSRCYSLKKKSPRRPMYD